MTVPAIEMEVLGSGMEGARGQTNEVSNSSTDPRKKNVRRDNLLYIVTWPW